MTEKGDEHMASDCHPRLDDLTHNVLTGLSQATGEPINKIVSAWLHDRAVIEAAKAKKVAALVAGCDGCVGTRGDSA